MIFIDDLGQYSAFKVFPTGFGVEEIPDTSYHSLHNKGLILLEPQENIMDVFNDTLVPGDKLYFSKKCVFPSSKLNKLSKDLSRTVKLDKCTKVVTDLQVSPYYGTYYCIKKEDTIYLSYSEYLRNVDDINSYDNTLADKPFKQYIDKNFPSETVYRIEDYSDDAYFTIKNAYLNQGKYILTKTLSNYLNPKLDTLDAENFDYYSRLMLSRDSSNIKLAAETLLYYNLEPWKSYFLLVLAFCPKLNNIAFNYLISLTGYTKKELRYERYGYSRNSLDELDFGNYPISYLMSRIKAFYKDPNSSKELMDNTKELIKKRIIAKILNDSDIADDLNLIGCSISINDSNRETDTSN